jgi:restriction endonuclease NaeI
VADLFHPHLEDPEVESVAERILESAGPDPAGLFANAIRQSIDEVLDGPRTGRWSFDDLEKTEKTYIGTKIEIVVRTLLGLERGSDLDLDIDGTPVDIKWAMNSGWQIPREAIDQICLCIGGLRNLTQFQVGVVRCGEDLLNVGRNQDKKTTLSTAGREAMRLLVSPRPLPGNFVDEMDPGIRARAVGRPTIQARIDSLFAQMPYTPIPRTAVATIARTTGDPMRRTRADKRAGGGLERLQVLSTKYGNAVVEALGRPPLGRDEYMAVPEADIHALPSAVKRELSTQVKKRLGIE